MAEFVIELHTTENMGDHAAHVVHALEARDSETIRGLIQRAAPKSDRGWRHPSSPPPDRLLPGDFLVIRSVVEEDD